VRHVLGPNIKSFGHFTTLQVDGSEDLIHPSVDKVRLDVLHDTIVGTFEDLHNLRGPSFLRQQPDQRGIDDLGSSVSQSSSR
jgi:hypothetical protein